MTSESSCPEPPTAILRGLVQVIQDPAAATGSLAVASHLLAEGTPTADRAALRLIAVWLMSDATAAERLRRAGAGQPPPAAVARAPAPS